MTAAPRFSLADAERRLGPTAIEVARHSVESAPPIRPELREQIRAVFESARIVRPAGPASAAA